MQTLDKSKVIFQQQEEIKGFQDKIKIKAMFPRFWKIIKMLMTRFHQYLSQEQAKLLTLKEMTLIFQLQEDREDLE